MMEVRTKRGRVSLLKKDKGISLHGGEKTTMLPRQISKPFLGAWCTGN